MKQFVLGSANFNQKYGFQKKKINQKHLTKIFKQKKIKYLDTSFDYQLSKKFIKKFKFKNFKIITKIKIPLKKKNFFLKNIEKNIENNLKIYEKKNFEAILFHNPNDLKFSQGKKLLSILKNLKNKKKIKKIGVSIYEPNDLSHILKIFIPDIVQFPLNIFNQNFIKHRYFQYLLKKKTIFQIRSIFLQGILLKNFDTFKGFKKNKKLSLNFKKLDNFCKKKNISRLEACIYFVNSIKGIKLITFGVNNTLELDEILEIFNRKKKIKFEKFNLDNKSVDPRLW
tara:strand:- start:9756 stop:10604 length:849 start_codon:yes stop_codon:yes gene_type:complete